MGVAIHYKGKLNKKEEVHQLVDEVADICESMDWKYSCLDEDWNIPPDVQVVFGKKGAGIEGHASLKGITFSPHEESESIKLLFNAEGRITSIVKLAFGDMDDEEHGIHLVSTKTQFAGADTHIAVVKLLRYLKSKYISDLDVYDETGYWETDNREDVEEMMGKINAAIDILETALSNLPVEPGDKPENIAEKIEDVLKKMGLDGSVHIIKGEE